jgi:phosphate uptake regulator
MDIRKIVKAGIASYTVSLPKHWIEKNKLAKGDSLYILEKSSNELMVSTEVKEKPKELHEITIVTDNKELGTIRREITAAYLNNYNTIIILGKDLESKAMEIRRFLHDFVALEIEEQTAGKISAKDLLDLKEISIEKTIRRIDMIIRSMIQDSIKSIEDPNLGDSIFYRDYDINRFYFLLLRLLKSALQDPLTALSFKLSNVQALQYWNLVAALEELGDSVKNLSPLFKSLTQNEQKSAIELYSIIQEDYLDALKAYYNKDKILADKVIFNRDALVAAGKNYLQKNNKVQNAEILNLLQEIISHINSIARLVLDY